MKTISVETLRMWLDEGRPVTILDVRPGAERAEWAIPGSLHVDAYAALKASDPEALTHVELPTNDPVVTVCAAGNTSKIAAEQLDARGVHALSLEGGMKAWSLAWNTAKVDMPGETTHVIQVRRTGKGCLSYIISADNKAAVIDASLDPQVYLNLTQTFGWQITHVLDTHIHADHLSRSRQLARMSGATLFLPAQDRATFPFTAISDGSTLHIGSASLTALHTPGHTVESTCYVLNNRVLFSGDTLFLAGVGRPDLDANEDEARERAKALYHSLHKLFTLPAEMLVLPGHTSSPAAFDGVPIVTTLAEIKERVKILQETQDVFVRSILARIPTPPPHYSQIVSLNKAGMWPEGDVTELEAGGNRCAIN